MLCAVLRRLLPPNEERREPARLLLAHKARHEALDREIAAAEGRRIVRQVRVITVKGL